MKRVAAVAVSFGCAVLAAATLTRRVPFVAHERQWSIGIYAGDSPFRLSSPPNVKNPVVSAADVTDVSAKFVADPFMIKRDTTWYMFFEVLNAHTNHGDIGFASSGDGWNWKYGRVVLDEPFHLSYPYVIESANTYYMIPESGETRSVRLYVADEFPTRWRFLRTLLVGARYLDPSIVEHGGKWWLFVETSPTANNTLRLYYADRLEGPWSEHPRSPIVPDNPHSARPAGRIVASEGKLYRLAQDDSPYYGIQVWAFEITELTTSSYNETPLPQTPVVGTNKRGWNARGMHHVDAHQVAERRWIASVDGQRNAWVLDFYHW